jgi:hypothetical protein
MVPQIGPKIDPAIEDSSRESASASAADRGLAGVDGDPVATSAPGAIEPDADENVFQVLARQARTRTPTELWITTVGGALSAVLIWSQNPALSWLGAGFAATAAYGIWGLLDRAASGATSAVDTRQITGLRDFTAIAGGGAALWAVLDFMAKVLGNWQH